jgi:hypothetical protein
MEGVLQHTYGISMATFAQEGDIPDDVFAYKTHMLCRNVFDVLVRRGASYNTSIPVVRRYKPDKPG